MCLCPFAGRYAFRLLGCLDYKNSTVGVFFVWSAAQNVVGLYLAPPHVRITPPKGKTLYSGVVFTFSVVSCGIIMGNYFSVRKSSPFVVTSFRRCLLSLVYVVLIRREYDSPAGIRSADIIINDLSYTTYVVIILVITLVLFFRFY